MPSCVAFNQWWRGAPHVQLMCGSRTAHMWLTCTVMPSHVAFNQWWRGAPHVQLMCGSRTAHVVAHVHGNALTCSIQSMVEGSPSRTAHVCGSFDQCAAHVWVMPSCVAFNQWWRGAPHVHTCGSHTAHVWLTCTVMPSCVAFNQWWRGALTYSSCVAHMWLTCHMVMPSRVAFNQWWRGAPHVQLMCGSRTAHVWLMCMVMPSRVAFNQWWRGAPHIQLTCGSRTAHVWLTYSSRVAHV